MRILHINAAYSPFVGGAETYLRAMSERLVAAGHEVTVVTSDSSCVQGYWDPRVPRLGQQETMINGVRVIRTRLDHMPFSPWSFYLVRRLTTELARLPFAPRRLLEQLAVYSPRLPEMEAALDGLHPGFDVVQGLNIAFEWPFIAGWRYARRQGIPFVATPFVHVGPWHVQRNHTMPHQLAVLRDAERVVVQTGIEGQELVRLGIPRDRIIPLGMGVNLEELQGGDATRFRAKQNIRGAIVTFLGAVTDDKGAVHLAQAMQRLWDTGSDFTLIIAGTPVEPSSFERVYRRLPEDYRQRIRKMGPVSDDEKNDMLAATDIFAMPSRVDSFGIAYLEAWAYRVPVIGCHAGGVPDVVDDGQDGLLVEYGDVRALASAIGSLLADQQRRREMGERGRNKVEGRYTWARVYDALHKIYTDLVGSSAQRQRND